MFNAIVDSSGRRCFANPGDLLTKFHVKATLIVARNRVGDCICLKISTYKGLGTTDPMVVGTDHTQIFTRPAGTKTIPGEQLNVWMNPLFVHSVSSDKQLDPMSRVDFGKSYTISHQVAVRELGILSDHSAPQFLENLNVRPLRDEIQSERLNYNSYEPNGSTLSNAGADFSDRRPHILDFGSGGIIRRDTVAGSHGPPSRVPETTVGRSRSAKTSTSSSNKAWLDTCR